MRALYRADTPFRSALEAIPLTGTYIERKLVSPENTPPSSVYGWCCRMFLFGTEDVGKNNRHKHVQTTDKASSQALRSFTRHSLCLYYRLNFPHYLSAISHVVLALLLTYYSPVILDAYCSEYTKHDIENTERTTTEPYTATKIHAGPGIIVQMERVTVRSYLRTSTTPTKTPSMSGEV